MRQIKILIVDDEVANLEALAYVLRMEGYEVLTAVNGSDALEVLTIITPDLVISDYMMPKMTGSQLAVKMKASCTWCGIPIILVTGAHAEQAGREPALFKAILSKPYSASNLLFHIAQVLLSGPKRPGAPATSLPVMVLSADEVPDTPIS